MTADPARDLLRSSTVSPHRAPDEPRIEDLDDARRWIGLLLDRVHDMDRQLDRLHLEQGRRPWWRPSWL